MREERGVVKECNLPLHLANRSDQIAFQEEWVLGFIKETYFDIVSHCTNA